MKSNHVVINSRQGCSRHREEGAIGGRYRVACSVPGRRVPPGAPPGRGRGREEGRAGGNSDLGTSPVAWARTRTLPGAAVPCCLCATPGGWRAVRRVPAFPRARAAGAATERRREPGLARLQGRWLCCAESPSKQRSPPPAPVRLEGGRWGPWSVCPSDICGSELMGGGGQSPPRRVS